MITIYHNPRCRKSREALTLIQESGNQFKVREYLKQPPTKQELSEVLALLNYRPLELIRKSESVFKERYQGKQYSDDQWIEIMIENPILIERPLVIKDQRAVLGRPSTAVNKLLNG